MRRISPKRAKRIAETREWRRKLILRVLKCEACGKGFASRPWMLTVHEIARGASRQKALDAPYAILVVDPGCHEELGSKAKWPVSRQLWALRRSRSGDFNLDAFNRLVGPGPKRVTAEEVNGWR